MCVMVDDTHDHFEGKSAVGHAVGVSQQILGRRLIVLALVFGDLGICRRTHMPSYLGPARPRAPDAKCRRGHRDKHPHHFAGSADLCPRTR